jgi:hypothetical protein|tara:strand:- start:190 stop:381 length:192 start_codon:yes stop_codon:yes gene_type:complete
MYKLFNHQGNVYKILREIPFHNFEKDGMEKVKAWRDWLGADHVLKSKTHFMFCETIKNAEVVL